MRKAPLSRFGTSSGLSAASSWPDIEKVAPAELSSEDPQHPLERALRTDTADGWKASDLGPQLIRLRFDSPQPIKRNDFDVTAVKRINFTDRYALEFRGAGFQPPPVPLRKDQYD